MGPDLAFPVTFSHSFEFVMSQSSDTSDYEIGYLLPKASVFTLEIYRG